MCKLMLDAICVRSKDLCDNIDWMCDVAVAELALACLFDLVLDTIDAIKASR